MHHAKVEPGILVYTGPMFCGKTSQLKRHLERFRIAKVNTVVFRPERDQRISRGIEDAVIAATGADLLAKVKDDHQVVLIDEAQFFPNDLVFAVEELALRHGKLVVIACLDLDFRGKPFGHVPELLAIATRVEKLTAVCKCGQEASRSQRIVRSTETFLVGDSESYEARCIRCFERPIAESQLYGTDSPCMRRVGLTVSLR